MPPVLKDEKEYNEEHDCVMAKMELEGGGGRGGECDNYENINTNAN
jgi:hypothetical protein